MSSSYRDNPRSRVHPELTGISGSGQQSYQPKKPYPALPVQPGKPDAPCAPPNLTTTQS